MRTGDGCSGNEVLSVLLTEEERKDDSKKESKWKLPGEEEILRKMQSSESDMSAHLQKNFNPKFFQFLLTEEERKDDSKKESKWKLPGEEEILRKMQSSESDMSAHLQKNFNPN